MTNIIYYYLQGKRELLQELFLLVNQEIEVCTHKNKIK
jgi:hypothetical protein